MNDEVKFTLSVDSKKLDKSLDKTLEQIRAISSSMEDFSKQIEDANEEQLNNIQLGISEEIEETTKELNKLSNELDKISKKHDSLFKDVFKLEMDKSHADIYGGEFTEDEKLNTLNKELKSLGNEYNRIAEEYNRLEEKQDELFNKEYLLENNLDEVQEKVNVIKEKIEEVELPDLGVEEFNLLNMHMGTFVNLLENASHSELSTMSENLVLNFNELGDITEELNNKFVEAKNNLDEVRMDELSYSLYEIEQQMEKTIHQMALMDNYGEFPQLRAALREMETSQGPSILEQGFERVKRKTKQLSNKIQRLGRRMAVAFSIAAFGTFRKAFNTAINLSETARHKFDAISQTIGGALVPIIDYLVEKVMYAFAWIAKLIYLLTGFNIIEKAIGRATKQMDGLGKSVGNAGKEVNKMLGGFDEINNIGGQTNVGGALGGALGGLGSSLDEMYNLKEMFDNIDISWAERLKKFFEDYWKILLSIAGVIATIWGVAKLVAWIGQLDRGIQVLKNMKATTGALAGGLLLLGGSAIAAATNWSNMSDEGKLLTGTIGVVGGVLTTTAAIAKITGVSMAAAFGPVGIAIGVVVGALVVAGGAAYNYWKEQKELNQSLETYEELVERGKELEDEYRTARQQNIDATKRYNESLKVLTKLQDETGISGKELDQKVKDGKLTFDEMTSTQQKVYEAYVKTDDAQNQMITTGNKMMENQKEQIITDLKKQRSNLETAESFEEYKDRVVEAWDENKISTEEARDLFEEAMADMDRDAAEKFAKNIPASIREGLNPTHYSTPGHKLVSNMTGYFNNVKRNAKKIGEAAGGAFATPFGKHILKVGLVFVDFTNWMIRQLNRLINMINKLPGLSIPNVPEINTHGINNIPSFAIGTNYVPEDMLANIHKGEAIIPAKFNDEKFFGNDADMSETNDLLEDIHTAISNLRLVVDKDSIGEASVNYIQHQNRVRGEAII